jgi:hypothetical protein
MTFLQMMGLLPLPIILEEGQFLFNCQATLQMPYQGDCPNPNRNEVDHVGWIVGLSLLVQLTSIPGLHRQSHRTAQGLEAFGITTRAPM